MVSELNLSGHVGDQLRSVAAQLIAKAPAYAKCVFLNCEMRETSSDAAISPDLFAVVVWPLFGRVKRVAIEVDWETADLLMAVGKQMLEGAIDQHVIFDLIIDVRGGFKAFRDHGPLRRLAGGDGMYRSKYQHYVEHNRWLADLHRLAKREFENSALR